MIMGKLLFGFILGNVASEISNWNKNEVEFKGKVAAVKVCSHAYFMIMLFMLLIFANQEVHDTEENFSKSSSTCS